MLPNTPLQALDFSRLEPFHVSERDDNDVLTHKFAEDYTYVVTNVTVTYATNATPSNRYLLIIFTDHSGREYTRSLSLYNQPIGTTITYHFGFGFNVATVNSGVHAYSKLDTVVLVGGDKLRIEMQGGVSPELISKLCISGVRTKINPKQDGRNG